MAKNMTIGSDLSSNDNVNFNVIGTIKQNNTQVSLEGHSHDTDYASATHKHVAISSTQPSSPKNGDVWFNI